MIFTNSYNILIALYESLLYIYSKENIFHTCYKVNYFFTYYLFKKIKFHLYIK